MARHIHVYSSPFVMIPLITCAVFETASVSFGLKCWAEMTCFLRPMNDFLSRAQGFEQWQWEPGLGLTRIQWKLHHQSQHGTLQDIL